MGLADRHANPHTTREPRGIRQRLRTDSHREVSVHYSVRARDTPPYLVLGPSYCTGRRGGAGCILLVKFNVLCFECTYFKPDAYTLLE